jgi:hypothetical protein
LHQIGENEVAELAVGFGDEASYFKRGGRAAKGVVCRWRVLVVGGGVVGDVAEWEGREGGGSLNYTQPPVSRVNIGER